MNTNSVLSSVNNRDFSTPYDDVIAVYPLSVMVKDSFGYDDHTEYYTAVKCANNRSRLVSKILLADHGNADAVKAVRLAKKFDREHDCYLINSCEYERLKDILSKLETTTDSDALKPKKSKKSSFFFRVESLAQVDKLRKKCSAIIEARQTDAQVLARFISDSLNNGNTADFATWTKEETDRINAVLEIK